MNGHSDRISSEQKIKDRSSGNFSINRMVMNVLIGSPLIFDESAALGCFTTFCVFQLLLPPSPPPAEDLFLVQTVTDDDHQLSSIQLGTNL
jgi:hypothetical protein